MTTNKKITKLQNLVYQFCTEEDWFLGNENLQPTELRVSLREGAHSMRVCIQCNGAAIVCTQVPLSELSYAQLKWLRKSLYEDFYMTTGQPTGWLIGVFDFKSLSI